MAVDMTLCLPVRVSPLLVVCGSMAVQGDLRAAVADAAARVPGYAAGVTSLDAVKHSTLVAQFKVGGAPACSRCLRSGV